MVVAASWLNDVADALSLTQTQTGVLLGFVVTFIFVLCILIVTKGREAAWTLPLGFLMPVIFWTAIGWFPIWMGSVVAIVISLFLAWKVSGGMK